MAPTWATLPGEIRSRIFNFVLADFRLLWLGAGNVDWQPRTSSTQFTDLRLVSKDFIDVTQLICTGLKQNFHSIDFLPGVYLTEALNDLTGRHGVLSLRFEHNEFQPLIKFSHCWQHIDISMYLDSYENPDNLRFDPACWGYTVLPADLSNMQGCLPGLKTVNIRSPGYAIAKVSSLHPMLSGGRYFGDSGFGEDGRHVCNGCAGQERQFEPVSDDSTFHAEDLVRTSRLVQEAFLPKIHGTDEVDHFSAQETVAFLQQAEKAKIQVNLVINYTLCRDRVGCLCYADAYGVFSWREGILRTVFNEREYIMPQTLSPAMSETINILKRTTREGE